MTANLVSPVKSFLQQRHALAEKEKQLIADLNRVLPQLGYRVVPIDNGTAASRTPAEGTTLRGAARSQVLAKTAPKSLACPRCTRRFAHPLHLGRHISATHGIKRKKRA
jgi:hypothetical protein